jgi:2,4-dienoyl-CoA reductase (NADPH2)
MGSPIFEPRRIGGIEVKNRILRSSVGGRSANYDGTVTDVWKNFEKRFADGGVGGIISTTFHVNAERLSPFQYPSLAADRYVPYLKKHIRGIRRDAPDCRYFLQIGDPGYATYSSLFPQAEDAKSSSSGFDFAYGYNNRRVAMDEAEIGRAIREYADAARRAQEAGADGLEITASKGYLVHQFLNPALNRRTDLWGGTPEKRFLFLERVLVEVRKQVGAAYPVGVRLSAADYMHTPLLFYLLRTPWGGPGNDAVQMLAYARRLRELGVAYLHVVSGFGFPNPRDVPGPFPLEEVKIFFNHVRHLSGKAALRATLLNTLPSGLARWLMNLGWSWRGAINVQAARRLSQEVGLPVIVNGGFQERSLIEEVLRDCDLVSMARALIANPDLPRRMARGEESPERPCSFCNRCVGRTGTSPLGCYDPGRFDTQRQMIQQIMQWNEPDPA